MKLALLDRDGTLIDVVRDGETGTITTAFHPSQIRLLDGVVEGLSMLAEAGYTFGIVTNQPGPAKGQITRAAVETTNKALVELFLVHRIRIAHVAVCMHHPDGGALGDPALIGSCECRKPKPGLLLDTMKALGAAPSETWMIGDSMVDVEAARAANVRAALLFATNRCELCPLRNGPQMIPQVSAPKLNALAFAILEADGRKA